MDEIFIIEDVALYFINIDGKINRIELNSILIEILQYSLNTLANY